MVAAELGSAQASLDSLIAEKLLAEMEFLTPRQQALYLEELPMERFGFGRGSARDRGHRRGRRQGDGEP